MTLCIACVFVWSSSDELFFLRSRIGTDSRNRKKEYRAQLSSRLYYNSARPDRARNSVTPVDLCHSRYAPAENAAWQYALRLVLSVQPFWFAFCCCCCCYLFGFWWTANKKGIHILWHFAVKDSESFRSKRRRKIATHISFDTSAKNIIGHGRTHVGSRCKWINMIVNFVSVWTNFLN